MILYQISEQEKNEFIETIENQSKNLGKEARQFLKDFLTVRVKRSEIEYFEGYFDDGEEYQNFSYSNYLKAKLKAKVELKEISSLEDIFGESVYPALDVLIGEEYRKKLIFAGKMITDFPYTKGYYRRMIRSSNYKNHFDTIWKLFIHFLNVRLLNIPVEDIFKRNYDINTYSNQSNDVHFALEINQNNEEVVRIIRDMLLSENNTNILDYNVFKAIFRSKNRELLEITGKLLLAAKLQEGLIRKIFSNFPE